MLKKLTHADILGLLKVGMYPAELAQLFRVYQGVTPSLAAHDWTSCDRNFKLVGCLLAICSSGLISFAIGTHVGGHPLPQLDYFAGVVAVCGCIALLLIFPPAQFYYADRNGYKFPHLLGEFLDALKLINVSLAQLAAAKNAGKVRSIATDLMVSATLEVRQFETDPEKQRLSSSDYAACKAPLENRVKNYFNILVQLGVFKADKGYGHFYELANNRLQERAA